MLEGARGEIHRRQIKALLQELKPARMKYLDEDQRRALEVVLPLVVTEGRKAYARQWHLARKERPELTKEDFIRDDLGFEGEVGEKLLQRQLVYLEEGEQLLSAAKRR
jgi:hypothetical protein